MISVKERYDDSELNFDQNFLLYTLMYHSSGHRKRSLMMLDSASRLICNGTFDEKRMAEEITFEMDFRSGFFFSFFGGWEVWQCREDGFL